MIRDTVGAAALIVAAFVPGIAELGLGVGELGPRPAGPLSVALLTLQAGALILRRRWPAVCLAIGGAVSAAIFGMLHLVNDPAAIGGALAIIAAGLMVAAAYVATRALWLPIGLHLGWNFAEGGLFGVPVSGANSSTLGLLRGVFDGPALVTGGSFGPESSVFAVLTSLLATYYFLRLAKRRGPLRPRPAVQPTV